MIQVHVEICFKRVTGLLLFRSAFVLDKDTLLAVAINEQRQNNELNRGVSITDKRKRSVKLKLTAKNTRHNKILASVAHQSLRQGSQSNKGNTHRSEMSLQAR